jgi:hypothetical protein
MRARRPIPALVFRSRLAGIAPAACALAILMLGGPHASAEGQVLASIDDIRNEGLYRELFTLTRPADIEIDAIGSGFKERDALLAYAWILDLRSRRPVWHMEAQKASTTGDEGNLHQQERLTLPAGDYALYFSAYGGLFPVEKTIRILDVIKLGSFSIKGGHSVDWNEYGDPDAWGATVRVEQGASEAGVALRPASEPDLGALVRIDKQGNDSYRHARLELTTPLRARLIALGEYSGSCHGFADAAWIAGTESCERVWEMTLVNTEPAGGGEKNRMFDQEVALSEGSYDIFYATDATHAYDAWNTQPPYDPESWGITLIPTAPVPSGNAQITFDPPDQKTIVRIQRVGDGEFREELFRLNHAVDVHVRALGEYDEKPGRFFDYGWIEDPLTLRKVWSMNALSGVYAGGECRNRLVEDRIHLDPGVYRVCYVTDDAHSYGGWSNEPPFDAEAWGIQVCGTGKDYSPNWVEAIEPDQLESVVVRIGPVGDDEDRHVRFEVSEPLTVRIVAVGEGRRGEMFDFARLEREDSGATVWEMRYEETHHAGGASKNRRVDSVLQLEPGRYVLHYVTDDSHAFGDWNEDPPDDPNLWGVTLIEVAGR